MRLKAVMFRLFGKAKKRLKAIRVRRALHIEDPNCTPTLVLGVQMARARAAEARHQKQRQGSSPLNGIAYDESRGELNLFRFVESPTDDAISQFLDDRAQMKAADRSLVRSMLTMDDFYTLLAFPRRCALLTLRTDDPDVIQAGLNAVSFIELKRIDSRDAGVAMALLSYAAQRTGFDLFTHVTTAASDSDRGLAQELLRFAREPITSLEDWGFREFSAGGDVILTSDNCEEFTPHYDLVSIAQEICTLIERDVWRVRDLTTGTDLPSVWLRDGEHDAVESALQSLRACVLVTAGLRPTVSAVASAQHLLAFVAETATAQSARVLAQSTGSGEKGGFIGVGVDAGTLCIVMVARSFVEGVESYEGDQSLNRFVPTLSAILARHLRDLS